MAIMNDRLCMGTLDATLEALDAKTGNAPWRRRSNECDIQNLAQHLVGL